MWDRENEFRFACYDLMHAWCDCGHTCQDGIDCMVCSAKDEVFTILATLDEPTLLDLFESLDFSTVPAEENKPKHRTRADVRRVLS